MRQSRDGIKQLSQRLKNAHTALSAWDVIVKHTRDDTEEDIAVYDSWTPKDLFCETVTTLVLNILEPNYHLDRL